MKVFTAVVEKCSDTGLYVGYVPGFPGAHTQGEILDELNKNLKEVIEMLLEDGSHKQFRHTDGCGTCHIQTGAAGRDFVCLDLDQNGV